MTHPYTRNHVHIVFGTKSGRKCIQGEVRDRLWNNLRDTVRQYGATLVEVGGTDDHVHLLVTIPPKVSVSVLLRAAKANSSKWMNDEGHFFAWQAGYAAFSVSASNLEKVAAYIRRQAEHHQRVSYQDEFSALLNKHGIEYTPRKVMA
jgi:REP element-mobilizing transposase RayT